jgi:hypothetical protein
MKAEVAGSNQRNGRIKSRLMAIGRHKITNAHRKIRRFGFRRCFAIIDAACSTVDDSEFRLQVNDSDVMHSILATIGPGIGVHVTGLE